MYRKYPNPGFPSESVHSKLPGVGTWRISLVSPAKIIFREALGKKVVPTRTFVTTVPV
jgi:hypothetical protein